MQQPILITSANAYNVHACFHMHTWICFAWMHDRSILLVWILQNTRELILWIRTRPKGWYAHHFGPVLIGCIREPAHVRPTSLTPGCEKFGWILRLSSNGNDQQVHSQTYAHTHIYTHTHTHNVCALLRRDLQRTKETFVGRGNATTWLKVCLITYTIMFHHARSPFGSCHVLSTADVHAKQNKHFKEGSHFDSWDHVCSLCHGFRDRKPAPYSLP